jgi:NadR type nicotinamide-nucleotide adenylyltransferase
MAISPGHMVSKPIKIAVIGAESTGKTALTEALAAHYNTNWVIEFSRPYLEALGKPYTARDVEAIARGQMKIEDTMAAETPEILFCDTNLLVIKIWMDHAYGATPNWILKEIEQRKYDLHILTDWDIPYEPDPLREHPEMRDYFTALYKHELDSRQLNNIIASGTPEQRLTQSQKAIASLTQA